MDSLETLQNEGYDINQSDYDLLQHTRWLADELISFSIKCHYGWGIPSEEAIISILKCLEDKSGLIEVRAGSGLWSAILSKRTNKEILGCELNLRSDTPEPIFYPALNCKGETLINENPNYPILIVWPDTNNEIIKIVETIKPGNTLILAGPIHCTGNDIFYNYLDKNFSLEGMIDSNKFSGETDQTYILKKLNQPQNSYQDFFSKKRTMFKKINIKPKN